MELLRKRRTISKIPKRGITNKPLRSLKTQTEGRRVWRNAVYTDARSRKPLDYNVMAGDIQETSGTKFLDFFATVFIRIC